MPQPKPRATGLLLMMPPIRSQEITWAQRSRVGHREDALQPLDFSNALFGVHSVSISNMAIVKRSGTFMECLRERPAPSGSQHFPTSSAGTGAIV